jgi:adenine-specific DNA-methyltransferase
MAKIKKKSDKKPIEQYEHKGKERLNNPPVGLVTPETDKETGKKKYAYDPHLDPSLQWAGKAEHTAFEVPTVSLHVHERIDSRTIIQAVRKKNGNGFVQGSLFQSPEENPPLRDAIEFYKHKHNWSNRLIAGDSLLVMNSLIEKEGLAGQVQMIYFDPPYGIKYGSNFQPFVNKRDVKDGKDEDLTAEPEMIKAFRDTWELGIHSYLTYLRDRLLLAKDLLHESGSVFVQISDENVHLVRNLMDEVFGVGNFISLISFLKTGATTGKNIPIVADYVIWYAKNIDKLKYNRLLVERTIDHEILDIFPFVEETNGTRRRWITCDTSRVSITLAKQRLMTALFDYYELAHPDEGVGSGFKYKTVPHITLKSIANNEPPQQETLYDQPFLDNSRARVTGPFTVEAVPSPIVKPLYYVGADLRVCPEGEHIGSPLQVDASIVRSGETLRQNEWRDELLKCGIRGKNNQYILFSRVEPLPGTRWLHADAETKPNDLGADKVSEDVGAYGDTPSSRQTQRVVISFGPEHAPLEQRQVALAIEEAQKLVPKPKIIVFASFQFDPEAAKDIDETNWPGVTLLKVQMNTDLLTDDLKKKRASNESFWLMGQPEVRLSKVTSVITSEAKQSKKKGIASPTVRDDDKELYQVEVLGFDYYNTKTGNIESGGTDRIAMWMLDTDYDGRSLFPRQVFFPMAGEKDGWARLAKNLKAEIDEELIEAYRGNVSLPFEIGDNRRIAVKIVDDRGIESLKILEIEE